MSTKSVSRPSKRHYSKPHVEVTEFKDFVPTNEDERLLVEDLKIVFGALRELEQATEENRPGAEERYTAAIQAFNQRGGGP